MATNLWYTYNREVVDVCEPMPHGQDGPELYRCLNQFGEEVITAVEEQVTKENKPELYYRISYRRGVDFQYGHAKYWIGPHWAKSTSHIIAGRIDSKSEAPTIIGYIKRLSQPELTHEEEDNDE